MPVGKRTLDADLGWRVAQCVEDGALAALAAAATANHPFELRGHPLQVAEPGLDVQQVPAGEPVDIPAGQAVILGQAQQAADLLQGEAQCASTADETLSIRVGGTVVAIPARRTRRGRQQPDALVVAHGFGMAPAALRDLSNLHGLDPVATPGFRIADLEAGRKSSDARSTWRHDHE